MKENKRPPLVVLEGGREALGRAMLRAHLEHRYEEARALVDRIASRATLRPVSEDDGPPESPGKDSSGV